MLPSSFVNKRHIFGITTLQKWQIGKDAEVRFPKCSSFWTCITQDHNRCISATYCAGVRPYTNEVSCHHTFVGLFIPFKNILWISLIRASVLFSFKNMYHSCALSEERPEETGHIHTDQKYQTQHFCFCSHFLWAEIKDLKHFLYAQTNHFSQI